MTLWCVERDREKSAYCWSRCFQAKATTSVPLDNNYNFSEVAAGRQCAPQTLFVDLARQAKGDAVLTVDDAVETESLLVVVTTGLSDGGRKAAIALGVALSALANGCTVHLFLSLESAILGTPTGALGLHPRGFSEPLSAYLNHFVELGGQIEVCSSCYHEYCREAPKDADGNPQLLEGATVRGLGIVAERAFQMPVLTF